MLTDKATSAFAKYAITFEAVPPGQEETNIIPTEKSGDNSKIFARL